MPPATVALRLGLAVCFLVLGSGCQRYQWSTPQDAYSSFVRALDRDERKVALSALSRKTLDLLESRAKQVQEVSGGVVRSDVESLLFGLPLPAASLSGLETVSTTPQTAVLKVKWGETVREVRMVKEETGWKVDLSDQLDAVSATTSKDAGTPGAR